MKKLFLIIFFISLTVVSHGKVRKSNIVLGTVVTGVVLKTGLTYAMVNGASASAIMSATAGTFTSSIGALAGVAGTSGAAATSSGLAAIGSTLGGGMAAGAVITSAAPTILAGAVIYGTYKYLEYKKSDE
jgi:hypothetical protein